MIESPKNFIEQFQNFIEHIAGVMKTFLTKEVADNYYLGKSEKASSASLADTATKATQDANGNVIPETYATKSELTSGLATKQPVGDYRTKSELDSIYLGINAKAKSAKTADTAVRLVRGGVLIRDGNPIFFSLKGAKSGSYLVPKSGVISYRSDIYDYPFPIGFSGSDTEGGLAVFAQAGDKVFSISGTASKTYSFTLYPMKLQ